MGWPVTVTDIVCIVKARFASVTFSLTLNEPFVANVVV